ncbi:MAG: DUF3124 domain-containing protein [Sulfurisoma sp.]|nr:DUF3124 domain-containing protein [Sulfurisoma sp.]
MSSRIFVAGLLPLFLFFAQPAAAQEELPLSKGQTVYLPVYSHLIHGNYDRKGKPDKVLLSALISIRGTDPKRPFRVASARYYNTEGKPLREFVTRPVTVPPMGTLELFVERHDESGGSGANFVIVWDADAAINAPLIEAVHANIEGARSVVFTTQGRPIRAE